jgi:nucleoside-diphosphate-sugar epimerase
MIKTKQSNILITGGAGYLGSVSAPALLNVGNGITVLNNLLFGQNSLMNCCRQDRTTSFVEIIMGRRASAWWWTKFEDGFRGSLRVWIPVCNWS